MQWSTVGRVTKTTSIMIRGVFRKGVMMAFRSLNVMYIVNHDSNDKSQFKYATEISHDKTIIY